MNFAVVGAVAAGGAIGSVARYLLNGFIQSAAWGGFPYGIFIVNISGGFIMGVLTELMALKFSVSLEWRAFLTTGILGGYTTFSTFSLDSAMLIERQAYGQAAAYIVGSALLSIIALFAGLWIVRVVYA
jgi:CrcB protein